jgi:hypothetical protein
VDSMILYLDFMKRYYELDRTISNIASQRQEVIQMLFRLSWSFDLQQLHSHAVRLILTIRRLTKKLVKLVKEWRSMRARKSATFFVVIDQNL